MTDEWRDLPTMADVAAAQAAGDEIENCQLNTMWNTWHGSTWSRNFKYRARPAQPKMKKVKILGWMDVFNGATTTRNEGVGLGEGWIRYPKLDDEIEVLE